MEVVFIEFLYLSVLFRTFRKCTCYSSILILEVDLGNNILYIDS